MHSLTKEHPCAAKLDVIAYVLIRPEELTWHRRQQSTQVLAHHTAGMVLSATVTQLSGHASARLKKTPGHLETKGDKYQRPQLSTTFMRSRQGTQTFSAGDSPARWSNAYLAAVSIASVMVRSVKRPMMRCLL